MIEAVIFDMDGILIDSEPFWQEAEINVFATVGIQLTRAQCIETTGMPVNDVVAYRFKQNPWRHKSEKEITRQILDNVQSLVLKQTVLQDGVMDVLEYFKIHCIPMAIASSSAMRLIDTVLKKFALEELFVAVHSAELENYGKPHPAVFLATANKLNIDPTHCLVFEDSINGLIAAKAARMKAIAIPMSAQWNNTSFDIADFKLKSIREFSERHWNQLCALP